MVVDKAVATKGFPYQRFLHLVWVNAKTKSLVLFHGKTPPNNVFDTSIIEHLFAFENKKAIHLRPSFA